MFNSSINSNIYKGSADYSKSEAMNEHHNKVLILDDEVELCMLLKSFFTRKNYEVFLAHTVADVNEMLDKNQFDLIFLDNNLPDGIGWELAPVISQKHPEAYIGLISAFNPDMVTMPPGAKYKVLEKPLRFSDIENAFSEVFEA